MIMGPRGLFRGVLSFCAEVWSVAEPSLNAGPLFAIKLPPLFPFLPKPELGEASSAAKKAAAAAAATALALYLAPKFPETTAAISQALTGFRITPGVGVKVTPAVTLIILPQPIGVVPPRMYGLPPETAHPKFYLRAFGYMGGRTANYNDIQTRLGDERAEQIRLYELNARKRFSDEQIERRINELQAMQFRTSTTNFPYPKFDELDQLVVLIAERSRRAGEVEFQANPDFEIHPAFRAPATIDGEEPPEGEPPIISAILSAVRFFGANPPDP